MKNRLLKYSLLSFGVLNFMFFFSINICAQVTLKEKDWVLPTYPVKPADKNPIFFTQESFQGASKHIYPYAMNDVFSTEKVDKAWEALVLENEYIKLVVTPEIGGKLYYAEDKTNGYNFVYKNDVVKPAYIGMTGAWVSGGIEWNVLHHHRASTFLPVDYELVENEDGSKTIWVGETEPRHQMRWSVGITMFPGKSYFKADIQIHNSTPYTHSFLYWANVATHTNENYQIIFPPSVDVVTMHSKIAFAHWPIAREIYVGHDFREGVDISWWKNSVRAASYFAHDLQEDFMGGYDHGKESGTVHIGNHHIVKGAKLWEWGSGHLGQTIEAQLTENAGPYVELMVGAYSDNQPDYSWIKPYEYKVAEQYWYPVKDIGGFKYANLNGAVNLEERENNMVFLGYYSTQKVENVKIILKQKDEVIFEKTMEISPEVAFAQSIRIPGEFKLTDLYTEMVNEENGEVLVSYQPVEKEYDEELPETVKPPLPPEEVETIEELYLIGKRIEQFYNPRMNPMDYYQEALKRDPGDIRTNIAVGTIMLKNGDYAKAHKHFHTAITRLTKDYTRPMDCEALYLHGLTLKAMKLYEAAIDTLYRATWDYAFHSAAYYELAGISVMKNDLEKAMTEINESLITNARNNSAVCLKAGILRKMGKYEKALNTLAPLLKRDPLDFRANNEYYLTLKESGDQAKADEKRTWLKEKMRDHHINYLEMAVEYLNDGMPEEAEDILSRYEGDYPMVPYYLGYLADKRGDKTAADRYFKKGSTLSVDYCFPFRLKTIDVLKTALNYNPGDGKAYYYLGNILYEKQPDKAISYWEESVKHSPDLAIAYRNLGWGYFKHKGDGYKAIEAYEKALEINEDDPLYYVELDELYEMSNTPIEKRLKLFEGKKEIVRKREDAFAHQIVVLTLAGKAEKAVEYLEDMEFTFNETSREVYHVTADAYLASGVNYYNNKQYEEALETFKHAQVPEELAFFSREGDRNIQVNHYLGLCHKALGNEGKAKEYFTANMSLDPGPSDYIKYYKGLSYAELGKQGEAKKIFNSILKEAEKQLNQETTDVDVFAKFGAEQSEEARLSDAYMLKGIAYKGLGDKKRAKENLTKAVELSASTLYAKLELENL